MDVEASRGSQGRPAGGSAPNNPYSSDLNTPSIRSWHPVNLAKRAFYITVSIYGLMHFKVYQTIFHSPRVSHEWFKIGLAATIAMLFVKAYVEMYEGKIKRQKVNYQNFKQSTHIVMILLLISSIAFHAALWPAYGAKTLVIMFLLAMFLLNFCMIMPTYVQNGAAFVVLTFFLQEYK